MIFHPNDKRPNPMMYCFLTDENFLIPRNYSSDRMSGFLSLR